MTSTLLEGVIRDSLAARKTNDEICVIPSYPGTPRIRLPFSFPRGSITAPRGFE